MEQNGTRTAQPLSGVLLGVCVATPLAAVFYVGNALLMLPLPFFELFDRVARILPGPIITFGIDTMVSVFSHLPGISTDQASKAAEQALAVVIFILLGALFGILTAFLYPRLKALPGAYVGTLVAVIPALLTLLMEGFNTGATNGPMVSSAWVIAIYLVGGMSLGMLIEALSNLNQSASTPENPARRRFLMQTTGAAALLGLVGWGVGRFLSGQQGSTGGAMVAGSGAAPSPTPMPTNMPAGSFVAVPGTRLEITPNNLFYRVDVNVAPPRVDTASYRLTVAGQVESAYQLSYAELTSLPFVEQHATLECISNPVGGELMSSTLWKGVTLKSLLDKAKLKDGVKEIKFTCADGYTESLPLESALDERTLLAYQTNGEPLTVEHGYPLRLYTPNRYGMKNPKWITKVEAIPDAYDGYWEVRGWNKDAFVKSTSQIDVIATDKAVDGVIPIGGVAFGGARGISKVELSVDGGPWSPATLKPPLSPLTWVLWRYDWSAPKGYHSVVVRCYDGKGEIQIEKPAPLHPDGASGYVSTNVMVS